VSRVCKS